MTEMNEIRVAILDIERRIERLERILGEVINALDVEQQLRIDYHHLAQPKEEQKP